MTEQPLVPVRGYDRDYDRVYTLPPEPPPPEPERPAVPVVPSLVPVIWKGLDISPGHVDDPATGETLTAIVENVEGWYGTPPLEGNDQELVLADGALWGRKIIGPRQVAITGAAVGPRGPLMDWRDQLAWRAIGREPVDLTITDPWTGLSLTAMARADADSFRHEFIGGRRGFRFEVTLTCADPRLYALDWRQVTLTTRTAADAGRIYPRRYGDPYSPAAMVIVPGGTTAYPRAMSEALPAAAGEQFTFTARVRAPAGWAGGAQLQLRPSAGAFAFSPNTGPLTGTTVTVGPVTWTATSAVNVTGWIQLDGAVPPPEAAVEVLSAVITRGGQTANANPGFGDGTAPWAPGNGAHLTWQPPNGEGWAYGSPYPAGSAGFLDNPGNADAPVYAVYTGDLDAATLTDDDTGRLYTAALAAGEQIMVATESLTAEAAGGQPRAPFIRPGSVPMVIPARSTARWHLYAQGSGSVVLMWRPAWM